jgi:hypothetical protein
MTHLDELLELAKSEDPIGVRDTISADELVALQIAAADERFQQMRKTIPILDQRAADVGVNVVHQLEDLVALSFSHTTYKSYPESFVGRGQWDRLLLWFRTVSATSMDGVDLEGVRDLDSWINRLEDAGHFLFTSSGTGGKNSFIDQTTGDVRRVAHQWALTWGWPRRYPRDNTRPIISLTPSSGPSKLAYLFKSQRDFYGRAGAIYTLADEPLRMGEINRVMRIQQDMTAGRATPSDVAEFERALAGKAREMRERYVSLVQAVDRHRHEPMTILGCWPQLWTLISVCEELGVAAGDFHPESIFYGGGGTKGFELPADYQQTIRSFFAGTQSYSVYGMSELSTTSPMCEVGWYHVPPWLTLLVVDGDGERLLDWRSGLVTGRAAFFDPVWEGHWGGLISGDWITANFGTCQCGRPGPVVRNDVRRASEVIGIDDDKISCAGGVEAYIRGAIAD